MSTSNKLEPLLTSISQYRRLLTELKKCSGPEQISLARHLCRTDLYFLLWYGLGRSDIEREWLLDRCKEVEAGPNGHLDLWAREHYKSTIITFGKTIQDVLNDPEITVGIFSHTRPIAKGFLRQIKRELEQNTLLKALFPDVLWTDPHKEAPKWSEDDGIVVRRRGNPKESTVEAWGLVDGQPTGKHFRLRVYDDVVTRESVTTPDMIQKTTEALELSYNLGTEGGAQRFIGTRYHFSDTYKTVIERGTAEPRIYAATDTGDMDGEPVLLSAESLANKRRDMGPYTFGCFVADTPVLMSDWSQKGIQDINIGDEVIGYSFGKGERAKLIKSKVVAKQQRFMPVVSFKFSSGREIIGTREHKFWHGRSERGYSQLGFGHGELKAACNVYDPNIVFKPFPDRAAGYLAGLFDGEGCVTGGTVHIAQSAEVNPSVCNRIGQALSACDVSFGVTTPTKRPGSRDFYVTGGRQGLMRFLHCVGDVAKRVRLVEAMLENGSRNIGKGARDDLMSIHDMGMDYVYNIQTETGNYVASGYAVKNCQMMLNPKADETQGFKREWLKHYKNTNNGEGMNKYLLVDPASEKKKNSDYTSAWVLGLASDGNAYVLEIIRDRLSLTQRADLVFKLHRRYQPTQTRYEKYGMMADIEHIKDRQERENYRFKIIEVGGQTPKGDRIKRLIPWFEQGKIYLPETHTRTDYQGKISDMVHVFIEEEYMAFPVPIHDDMLDSLARLAEPDLPLVWPKEEKKSEPRALPRYNGSGAWMGALALAFLIL